MQLPAPRKNLPHGSALLGLLLTLAIIAALFLAFWHYGFSGDAGNTIQSEVNAVDKARALQQKMNAQGQSQQQEVSGLSQ